MNVLFEKRFYKDLERLRHQSVVRNQIQQIIEIVKATAGPSEIPHLRKLSGSGNIFRICIGDYRLGIYYPGRNSNVCSLPFSSGYLPIFSLKVIACCLGACIVESGCHQKAALNELLFAGAAL